MNTPYSYLGEKSAAVHFHFDNPPEYNNCQQKSKKNI